MDVEGKRGILHGRTWASKLPKTSLNMGGLRLKARGVPEEIAEDAKEADLLRGETVSEEVPTGTDCGHE